MNDNKASIPLYTTNTILITMLLAYLRVSGGIAISWLWVFAPIWINVVIALVAIIIISIIQIVNFKRDFTQINS